MSLGVASFITTTLIRGKLALALDGIEGVPGLLLSIAAGFIGPAVVSPAIAWAAGLILSARPAVVGVGMTLTLLGFEAAILSISGTYELVSPLFLILQLTLMLIAGSVLCTITFRRGVANAERREAARLQALEASSALANLQFTPVTAAPELQPDASAPSSEPTLSPADALAGAAVAATPATPEPSAASESPAAPEATAEAPSESSSTSD